MIKYFRWIGSIFGVDWAIFYTSVTRIIQAASGVVTIFFVAKFLTGIEQGFYYTFGSILAIQIFFELGLNGIITQYVAHEVSHLYWNSEICLSGSPSHLSRLSSLLHFGVKWYSIIAGFLFVILLVSGFLFFSKYDKSAGTVSWLIPWFILSFSTTVAFLLNPILAFIQGLGHVKQVARIRLILQLSNILLIWTLLLLGAKLYAGGLSSLGGLIILIFLLFFNRYKKILINIWNCLGIEKINYRNEILPYQWKIALSWVSGYFIFQLFNPVLFATEGATVAGQMGMTLTALNGIFSLSFSWMSTKVPFYSGLIAQKKYFELDYIFNKALKQSSAINGICLFILFVLIFGLKHFKIPLGNRFLSDLPLTLMMIPIFLNQFGSAWATYLRCHKKEPFLIVSIVSAILCSFSTIFLGKYFGVLGVTSGYCIITLLLFPWGYLIYKTKKAQWHS